MYQIYTGFYVILAITQCLGGSTLTPKEGEQVTVNCVPSTSGTLVFWFRIKGDGPEYLFSSKNADTKDNVDAQKYLVVPSGDRVRLAIQSFNKKTDSGVYACAAMNNYKLIFGKHTIVNGEPDPTPPPSPKITPAPTKSKPAVATTPCACKKTESKNVLNCEMWILFSLSGGCGLLLILLVITILYCNRLRTRRCPHHYKRQPQNRPAGHTKLPNSNF
ncbi:T-cell surface glycoprotein CD8 alpha chain-like [Triplophysa dalaica]|uniref:T-cell surface glycoprotein CD8 alpha chain-like n=1 Tax=Triplophysa dalaica TaxID=1582913 RepID=UPI0024DF511D|nr:T-cell surface glycoprotein CD8 alpha chain-like [Triplophysa dalaica]